MIHKETTLSYKLVKLAKRGQYGHSRTPRNYYMSDPDDATSGNGYCDYYHSISSFDGISFEEWRRIARLSKRYRRFCHYMTEVYPEWKDGDKTYWADNSIDMVQYSEKTKQTRTIMIDGPHGDVCY